MELGSYTQEKRGRIKASMFNYWCGKVSHKELHREQHKIDISGEELTPSRPAIKLKYLMGDDDCR